MNIDDLTLGQIKQLRSLLGSETDSKIVFNDGEVRIVVLQRGWAYVGNYYRDGDLCRLENAQCIRKWGTTKGLGEIAESGPTQDTILDPAPLVEFDALTVVLTIRCEASKWEKTLKR